MPTAARRPIAFLHPIHSIILAFPIALYPSALLADIAYLQTAVIQWSNFSQWLIVGAQLFAGLLLGWALFGLFSGRTRHFGTARLVYLLLVAAMFALGMINAFQHSRDGWHSVGTTGLVLSIACTLIALATGLFAYGRSLPGENA